MYYTSHEIEDLVCKFKDCTLPRSQWTHSAHLTVALWYLLHHSLSEATERIRERIHQYNNAMEISMTRDSGYHETMTLFWIRIVHQFLADIESNDRQFTPKLLDQLIQQCGDAKLPFKYYSHDRLLSWQARTTWVEPDLMPM